MSPIQILSRLFKVSPKIAAFILAGLAVFAAAAIVLSFGSNIADLQVVAIYILVLAAVATVVAFILNDGLMRATICWICITAFGGWTIGLFDSALQISGRLPALPCYIRLPVTHPDECLAQLAPTVAEFGTEQQEAQRLPSLQGSPERLWFAQATPAPNYKKADPALVSDTQIFVHFGDNVAQKDIETLADNLIALDWRIPDGNARGEQVENTPQRNEVRYFHPQDSDAAIALAETLYALSPDTPISVRDFSRLGSYVPNGQFEIWVNALSPQEQIMN
ncbi:hypothetical protein [Loktanella sp. S4079]|uniref:hypothetical protein n=1 Tax=Loktanella sp. S4079 TaxID=579483 RepID=UPI000A68FBED|nr:hypothetical protein [Loktanella sp. S4079]